ncbi:MAG: AsnC family transcriptional regulator [Proteobacteria bacterium]|nr:AsnC family transcriptional regulator [Pseudomonadota bacterium]
MVGPKAPASKKPASKVLAPKALDALDSAILHELDLNSRQNISHLARTLRTTRDRVEYRMQRLESRGIIAGYQAVINPYKFGLTIFKTYLKLEHERSLYRDLKRALRTHPSVFWLAECSGRWDLIFTMLAPNPQSYFEMQTQLLAPFTSGILESQLYTFVDVWVAMRSYFVRQPNEHSIFYGGAPEHHQIDALDLKILKLLARDARISVVELATKTKSTVTTISGRIERLEALQIIAGYQLRVNLDALGYLFFKAQIYFSRYSPESERSLRDYCLRHPNITFYARQLGQCYVEIELEVPGYQAYNHIRTELRERFTGVIRSIETVLLEQAELSWHLSEPLLSGAGSMTAAGRK